MVDEEQPPPDQSPALTSHGRYRDAHGVWVTSSAAHYLGRRAVASQAEATRATIANLEGRIPDAATEPENDERVVADLEQRVDAQKQRALLTATASRLDEFVGIEVDANRDLVSAQRAREKAVQSSLDAERAISESAAALVRRKEEHENKEKEVDGMREFVAGAERRRDEIEPQIAKLRPQVPALLQIKAADGALSTPELAQRDLDAAMDALKRFRDEGPIPDETVRQEHDVLRRNLEDLELHVRERQAEADAASKELEQCRGDYLDVVRSTLNDYTRRARALADLATARLEVDLPKLENQDKSIDEAGIVVRIGFDGKAPTDLADTAHSGGQQVVAGLILLMSMAETDGESFFIVDEPFAHLSLDRVDDVGQFLKRSGAQFLITVPTTLDRGQLDPASLLIVLTKKSPRETFAPRPLVGRA